MKRLSEQTLYEVLEVPPDATRGAIAAAVQRARALYGPGSLATYTLMTSDEAAQLTRRIDDAEATLLDERARARYDAALSDAAPPRPILLRPGARAAAPGREGLGADGRDDPGRLPPPPEDEEDAPGPARQAGGHAPIPLSREAPTAAPAAASTQTAAPRGVVPRAAAPTPPVIPARAATPLPSSSSAPAAPPVSDATSWTGEVLRRLREARGISLDQLSQRIKVTRHHIENIEADRFESLPAAVYLRGILLSLSRELRLDGQKVARSYLERVAAGGQKPR